MSSENEYDSIDKVIDKEGQNSEQMETKSKKSNAKLKKSI